MVATKNFVSYLSTQKTIKINKKKSEKCLIVKGLKCCTLESSTNQENKNFVYSLFFLLFEIC